MPKNKELMNNLHSLPMAQQIGLYVILRFAEASEDNFSFLSSEFATKFKPFANESKKTDSSEYGRFIGGILSGLSRNEIIKKVAGDRDARWALTSEIKNNFELFRQKLFEVKTYWT